MKEDNYTFKLHIAFVLSLIIFLVLDVFFVIYKEYYHYGVNTGTIAYITIAQKYIRGDFSNAVVGGFTPLPSWLLIPLLKLGVAPVSALYVLNLIIGLLILIGVRVLSYRFEMTENIRNIISFVAVPIVLHFTVTEHIPDLLVVCSIVYYLNIVFNPHYTEGKSKGILCGTIGAFGYLGKAFMFPFFISHFLLFNLLHYFRVKGKKKDILRNAILGIVLFSIISGLWIAILSNRYNKLTFDTSGTYNHRIIGPEVQRPSSGGIGWEGWRRYVRMGHPVYDHGFFPPPNETAISIWEDFTSLTPYLKPWSPFESWDNLKYQIDLILKNIYYTIGIFESYFSLFSGVIIIGYILIYFLPFNLVTLCNHRVYPLLTLFLYCGGYLLVYPTERYLWINNILILLMGAHLLYLLFQSKFFNDIRKNVLIFFFILSFITVPLKNIVRTPNNDRDLGILSKKIAEYDILSGKKIASNDKFSETLKLIFYLNAEMKYYGQAKKNISDKDLKSELGKYDIDYYLVWGKPSLGQVPPFLSHYKEITDGDILYVDTLSGERSSVRIYSLKERKSDS